MVEKTCPECGYTFTCSHSAQCWCSIIKLSPEDSSQLMVRYGSCLCEKCLRKYAEANFLKK